MHDEPFAMFAEIWVGMIRVVPMSVRSERSDGTTYEVVAFV